MTFEVLAERTNRELDAVHDFFEHSKFVWDIFQLQVSRGYKAWVQDHATGSAIDQDELLRRAPQYMRRYLAVFTFRQFVSTFEVFLFSFLHRILLHNPWQFAKTRMDFDVILKAKDRDEAISEVILKQLNELRYEKLRDWFDGLNRALQLDCPSDEEINALAEVKATRDILEHNAGVVNDIYLRKAGNKARYIVGEQIEIDDTYHLESWRLIKKVVGDVSGAALVRLAPSAAPTT